MADPQNSATPRPRDTRGVVLVTGSTGFIGRALVERLAKLYTVVGLDFAIPPTAEDDAETIKLDVTSDGSVKSALARVRAGYGTAIASVIHLAAYFDLTGEDDPRYESVTVRGTERLLRELQSFDVEQFIFASSMLVHAGRRPGERITEESPIDPRLPYRRSKAETEKLICEQRGKIPAVLLRPAGVYDDMGRAAFLSRQIARIFERRLISRFYPGSLRTGQAWLHLDDFIDAVERLIERRRALPAELPLLLGEPDAPSFDELQRRIGKLLHNEPWETLEIPKTVAKTGAWIQDEILDEDPFIKPWMVDIADDHYDLDIARARDLLGWRPRHSLLDTLPRIAAALKADPVGWYRANKLNAARVAGLGVRKPSPKPGPLDEVEQQRENDAMMDEMHRGALWAHLVNIALGLWLITRPSVLGLFDPATALSVARDVTAERNLPPGAWRNAMLGWSEIVSGALIMLFGMLSLSRRTSWAQWANAAVGVWLLFAPLVFWTTSAAAYNNDTIVGALVIAFAVLVPMMPGMSHEAMMGGPDIPPGWTYSPSTYTQRLPIIALALVGFFVARYLAAFQLGHVAHAWDPFFGPGTETIITSDVSKAWPIADAGLGAVTYVLEALMGAMGDKRRWRTMPWMVLGFGILVVPLGAVSIFFIIIQPIVMGTWCSLCLFAAAAMVAMIPYSLDEIVASCQYLTQMHREGKSVWRHFFMGGTVAGGTVDQKPEFRSLSATSRDFFEGGVSYPLTLSASAALGVWLMFTRFTLGTVPPMADSDHLVGSLVVTTAFAAMADVGRPLRFINAAFGAWLVAAPWLLYGATGLGYAASILTGLALILLSLPRAELSGEHYGRWDRLIV
jgi:nucleoside-diphosphate-sugar epimerase